MILRADTLTLASPLTTAERATTAAAAAATLAKVAMLAAVNAAASAGSTETVQRYQWQERRWLNPTMLMSEACAAIAFVVANRRSLTLPP